MVLALVGYDMTLGTQQITSAVTLAMVQYTIHRERNMLTKTLPHALRPNIYEPYHQRGTIKPLPCVW